nr:MAG TPA: hypothetical protein [Caudoviricetes sp.]
MIYMLYYSLFLEYFDRKCHMIYNVEDKRLFKHLCLAR